jgi:hypothetical protein
MEPSNVAVLRHQLLSILFRWFLPPLASWVLAALGVSRYAGLGAEAGFVGKQGHRHLVPPSLAI